jgi:hypothetical protein
MNITSKSSFIHLATLFELLSYSFLKDVANCTLLRNYLLQFQETNGKNSFNKRIRDSLDEPQPSRQV